MASPSPAPAAAACFGGLNLDRQGRAAASVVAGSSNPVQMETGVGGVAANVARGLAALGCPATLVARVGTDHQAVAAGVATLDSPLLLEDPEHPTASYTTLIEPDGRLFVGIADMAVHDHWTHADIDRALAHAHEARLWFVDANLPDFAIARLCTMSGRDRVLAANGVSARKAERLARCLHRVDVLFANAEEAAVLGLDPQHPRRGHELVTVVTHGAAGLRAVVGETALSLPAPSLPGAPVDETGAGDCLIAGTLAGRLGGLDWPQALALGLAAAAAALCSADAVPEAALKALASAAAAG